MADINLSLVVKDSHLTRVFDALSGYASASIDFRIDRGEEHNWAYLPQGADTNKQWAERFLRQLVRAFVRCYELNTDIDRYKTELDSVSPPSQSVPDGIVE